MWKCYDCACTCGSCNRRSCGCECHKGSEDLVTLISICAKNGITSNINPNKPKLLKNDLFKKIATSDDTTTNHVLLSLKRKRNDPIKKVLPIPKKPKKKCVQQS